MDFGERVAAMRDLKKPIAHGEGADRMRQHLNRKRKQVQAMTPEQLQEIRDEAREGKRVGGHFMPDDVLELLDYIDLLHEDLRITRAERDAEKAKRAQQSKDYTADALRWDEAFTNIRADAYNDGWANALEAHAHDLDAQGYAPFARWARRTAKDTK